jgi:PASTA domain
MNKTNDSERSNMTSRPPNQPPSNRATPAIAGTHRFALTLLRSVVLGGVGCLAIAALVNVARPAAVSDVQRSAGGGSGTSSIVDFSEAARSPDARTPPPVNPRIDEFQRRTRPVRPSRPTSGSREVPPATAAPHLALTVNSNFDGISEVACPGCGVPPDPNAATSGAEIVEVVNTFIQVTDKTGAVLCGGGVTLNRLLRSSDSLTDPRVQFDNVHQRFSLAVTVAPASNSATPAMWVAASDTADACGTWRVFRLTFSGSPFPAGTFLDFPMLGQDTNALLISTRNLTPTSQNFTVFGLPKSAIYAGTAVSFSTFNVPSLTAPITNAGQPMISSPFSFFLAAVPGTGYRLFRLTNSGGTGAMLTLQATIHSPFNAPSRKARQPGTTSTVDSSDGNILASPYFDGTSIWFTHVFDFVGFPTIRYGAVNVSTNTVTTAMAFHSSTSDDFNPSLAVGLSPNGTSVFLNWAFTDAPAGTATSVVLDTLPGGQPIANLIGTGTVLVNGSTTSQTRFGDFSSVALDPQVPGGTCAVAAQQYFRVGGSWNTRLARLGTCQPPILVPDVLNDSVPQAGQVLVAATLTVGQVTNVLDPTCNNIGTVLRQNPHAGTPVLAGSAVNLSIGKRPPPPFECP